MRKKTNKTRRPKQPKTALPPGLRKKMGLEPRREEDASASDAIYRPGAGVLAAAGSAPDGKFLKRNSGVPASQRASALAQRSGYAANARAVVARPSLADGGAVSAQYGATNRARKPKPGGGLESWLPAKPTLRGNVARGGAGAVVTRKPKRTAAPSPYDEVL
jgi:hypothetical protein